jgi:hypothetical protein
VVCCLYTRSDHRPQSGAVVRKAYPCYHTRNSIKPCLSGVPPRRCCSSNLRGGKSREARLKSMKVDVCCACPEVGLKQERGLCTTPLPGPVSLRRGGHGPACLGKCRLHSACPPGQLSPRLDSADLPTRESPALSQPRCSGRTDERSDARTVARYPVPSGPLRVDDHVGQSATPAAIDFKKATQYPQSITHSPVSDKV